MRVWDVRRRALTGVRFQSSSPSMARSAPTAPSWPRRPRRRAPQIRDTQSGRLVAQLSTPDLGPSVAFSRSRRPPGHGPLDGTGQLWSTETWRPVGRPLEGHDGERLLWIEFSPDGSTLAIAGLDGTVGLWDATTQTPIGTPLTIEPETFLAADLSQTAHTSSPFRPAAAPSAGTSLPRPGNVTPVASPGAGPPGVSGATRCPPGRTAPSAPPAKPRARLESALRPLRPVLRVYRALPE